MANYKMYPLKITQLKICNLDRERKKKFDLCLRISSIHASGGGEGWTRCKGIACHFNWIGSVNGDFSRSTERVLFNPFPLEYEIGTIIKKINHLKRNKQLSTKGDIFYIPPILRH